MYNTTARPSLQVDERSLLRAAALHLRGIPVFQTILMVFLSDKRMRL